MILKSVYIVGDKNENKKDIKIDTNKITSVSEHIKTVSNQSIFFDEEVIAFSGLINSHDHLGLNTHDLHKNRVYEDYVDWASDNFEGKIQEINNIPLILRYQWSILKNMLHGFTTVIQHDKAISNFKSELVDVITSFKVIHSLHYDSKWRFKILVPSAKKKMIHLGEGTSDLAKKEPKQLLRWTVNPKQIITIHGIAMDPIDVTKFGGFIWCPNSNMHLYGTTANITPIKSSVPILLGTDSTVSSDWNIFKHLRQARAMNFLNDEELFNTITKTPAELFKWLDKGCLGGGKIADVVIAKKKKNKTWDAFFGINSKDILLIIKSGDVIFFDEANLDKIAPFTNPSKFEKIKINNSTKYIKFQVKKLFEEIKKYHPEFTLQNTIELT